MKEKLDIHYLTRRESQVMDIVYAQGEATAREIWKRMANAPTYSAVRALLATLVEKQQLVYHKEGKTYIYRPTQSRRNAAKTATQRLVDTYFSGSLEQAVMGLLGIEETSVSEEQQEKIQQLIEGAKKRKSDT